MPDFDIGGMVPLFELDSVSRDFDDGKIIFFAGGTGHPYFSTDSGTVLRAIEIEADMSLLAKAIDGVYDSDPKENKDAKRFDTITIDELVEKELKVIDLTASVMLKENKIPLGVFSLNNKGVLKASKTYASDGWHAIRIWVYD